MRPTRLVGLEHIFPLIKTMGIFFIVPQLLIVQSIRYISILKELEKYF